MNVDTKQAEESTFYEERARYWDKVASIVLVIFLLLPFPFARFMAWPAGGVISEHLIMPWSHFRICYLAFPDGDTVEDSYEFTWKGKILGGSMHVPLLLAFDSLDPPVLKWQNTRELPLANTFFEGDLIRVETFWQPLLLWPLKMVWGASRQHTK